MKKILLPVDGSETCFKAYQTAKDLAEKFDSEVHVLHVRHEFTRPYLGEMVNIEIQNYVDTYHNAEHPEQKVSEGNYSESLLDDIAYKILDNAEKYFKDDDIKVETRFLKGRPANTILDYAEDNDFDLIIMCTHGMSTLKRFTLGSVTNKVVHHAKVPVLVIK